MHVGQFLKTPEKHAATPVFALFGGESFLKGRAVAAIRGIVLSGDGGGDPADAGDDFSFTRFNGKEVDLRTVLVELSTISMWGDRRLVVVDNADDFVSDHRSKLEEALERPPGKSVLVLDVTKWAKNTRLYKLVEKVGLNVECSELAGGALERWLIESCEDEYEKQLTRDSARLMIQLAGDSLGLLNQELAKLAAFAGDRRQITPDDVTQLVGGWRTETTWEMLDAVYAGNNSHALACLEKLLRAGEAPQMILGGVIFRYRQLAAATERSRRGTRLSEALKAAKIWGRGVQEAERYLRRVGRAKAEQFYRLMLEADADLKGGTRLDPQVVIETLLIRLSAG